LENLGVDCCVADGQRATAARPGSGLPTQGACIGGKRVDCSRFFGGAQRIASRVVEILITYIDSTLIYSGRQETRIRPMKLPALDAIEPIKRDKHISRSRSLDFIGRY